MSNNKRRLAQIKKQINAEKKVFVAMSGGVDSSVAAALLIKQGYSVIGAHIKCFNVDGCGEKDAEDARRVAEQLKIPFYVFDLEKEYKKLVVRYMIDGYKKGLTPNPDVMCNKEIKFGLFLKKALELGADYVATGHYVRLQSLTNNEFNTNKRIKKFVNSKKIRYSLMVARDHNKDQSYFLWTLTQAQLKHCLFPIGEYKKSQVRKMAEKFGLLTAEKKDSQGICFLGKVSLPDFLKNYLPVKKGVVLNTIGEKIGEHQGAQFYTIGQRHGFRIMNTSAKLSTSQELGIRNIKPHYIIDKNIKNNTLTVAEGNNNEALYKKEINLINVNFISNKHSHILKNVGMFILVRVRYRQPLASATLTNADSTQTNADLTQNNAEKIQRSPRVVREVHVVFDKPQKFIAPGQSAVFYNVKGEMLGGGVIV